MNTSKKPPQLRLDRASPGRWRVTLDNPPLNLMGPEFVLQFRAIIEALENDDQVRVVTFESAVEGFFLNHSDFLAKLEDLTSIPQGPTGLEAWPDILVRLTRASVVSIAVVRGRATGNGSELSLACDMTFASREKSIFSQWEVGSSRAVARWHGCRVSWVARELWKCCSAPTTSRETRPNVSAM